MRLDQQAPVKRIITTIIALFVLASATAAGATSGYITIDFDVDPETGQAAVDAVNASMEGTGATITAGRVTPDWPTTDGSVFTALTEPPADDVRIDFDYNVDAVSVYVGAVPLNTSSAAYDAAGNLVAYDSFIGSGTIELAAGCIRSVVVEHAGAAFLLNDLVFHPMHDDSGCDDDSDGVLNGDDVCADTAAGVVDSAPDLKHNRYGTDESGVFMSGSDVDSGLTLSDTAGCSASQIIDAAGLGNGHVKFGLSRGALLDWVAAN